MAVTEQLRKRGRDDRKGTLIVIFLAGAWLTACAIAIGIHAWNMHGAALECPGGDHVDRGGWAEPDFCTTKSGDILSVADRGPYDVADPPVSAIAAAIVILGGATAACLAIHRFAGASIAASFVRFMVASAAIVLVFAIVLVVTGRT